MMRIFRFSKQNAKKVSVSVLLYLMCIGPLLMFSISVTNARADSTSFTIDSSVNYEVNYTLYYNEGSTAANEAKLWMARMENWSSVQDSTLLDMQKPYSLYNYTQDPWDQYNNSYDYFHKKFPAGTNTDDTFELSYSYNVILYSRGWEIPNNLTLSVYDTNSELYNLYTKSLPFCEANDTVIIELAKNLTKDYSGIVEKARNIYDYIIQNMNYEIQKDVLGAKKALELKKGDCSEFSSLMVALLRASGIPARKVLGIGIVDLSTLFPYYDLQKGQTMAYNVSSILGHAWIQYFIPDYGWISCDPTWGQAFYDPSRPTTIQDASVYFNRIDYNHLITTVGDWYQEGIDPPLEFPGSTAKGTPEFLYYYFLASDVPNNFAFDLTLKVLDTNIIEPESITIDPINILFLAGFVGILIIIVFWAFKPKKK